MIMTISNIMGRNLEADRENIISLSALAKPRIWNIYLYGSRIYGTNKSSSDLDAMVVASSMNMDKEIKDATYNIHIVTPDAFVDRMKDYRMVYLECIFAPQSAILQEKRDLKGDFAIDREVVKKHILSQSHDSWVKAKMKFKEMDILRGTKSVFHSLRILDFGEQLVKNGRIVDFSSANKYWQELDSCNCVKWDLVKEKFLDLKRRMEDSLIKS